MVVAFLPLALFSSLCFGGAAASALRFGFPCQFRLGFSSFDALDVLILLSPLFLRQLDSTLSLPYLRSQHLIQPTTISQKRHQPADIHLVFAAPLHSLIFATVPPLSLLQRHKKGMAEAVFESLHPLDSYIIGGYFFHVLNVDRRQSPRIVFLRPDSNSRVIPPLLLNQSN